VSVFRQFFRSTFVQSMVRKWLVKVVKVVSVVNSYQESYKSGQ
jgi:hypothetical protein